MTIEELFGTLQMSVVAGWRKHLRAAKYSKHMALDEFYKEMPEKVDALIEAWMGAYGKKVGAFQNLLQSSNLNTIKYLGELKRICKEGYGLLGDNDELKSLMDDIVNLINSTLYKVKELSENKNKFMNLKDYINESLVNEVVDNKFIKLLSNMYNDYGDLSPISDCFHWLDELGWKVMKEIKYAEAVNDINDSVEIEYALDYYAPVMLAMAKAGKKDTIKAISKITDKSEMEDFDINESLVTESKYFEVLFSSDMETAFELALHFNVNSTEDEYYETWDGVMIDADWAWKNKTLIKKFCKACKDLAKNGNWGTYEFYNFPWDDEYEQMQLFRDELNPEDGECIATVTGDGDNGRFFVLTSSKPAGKKAIDVITSISSCVGGWNWETFTFDESLLGEGEDW